MLQVVIIVSCNCVTWSATAGSLYTFWKEKVHRNITFIVITLFSTLFPIIISVLFRKWTYGLGDIVFWKFESWKYSLHTCVSSGLCGGLNKNSYLNTRYSCFGFCGRHYIIKDVSTQRKVNAQTQKNNYMYVCVGGGGVGVSIYSTSRLFVFSFKKKAMDARPIL
jgi:hypothetical protein